MRGIKTSGVRRRSTQTNLQFKRWIASAFAITSSIHDDSRVLLQNRESGLRFEHKVTRGHVAFINKALHDQTMDSNLTSDMERKAPLTKPVLVDIISEMRLIGGAPASDKMKAAYVSRLGGLLKKGALQLLDQPEMFKKSLDVDGRSATSSLGYVKPVLQFIQTLHQTGRWSEFYDADFDRTAIAYRQLSSELHARQKMDLAEKNTSLGEGCH